MTTGRINQVNGGASTRLRPFLAGQHRGPTSPPASKQHFFSVRRVASHFPPWPEGQCLAPSADGRGPSRAKNAPRRRGWNFSRPRAKNGGPPAKAVRAWQRGSYTPAPTEDPAGEQGIAPFSSIARGRSTPESCYPLIHIRRDERAGRDSEIAGARRYEHRL